MNIYIDTWKWWWFWRRWNNRFTSTNFKIHFI